MTRKKFVKRLMAAGISRNGANLTARAAQIETNYAETWFILNWIYDLMPRLDIGRFESLVTTAAKKTIDAERNRGGGHE